MILKCFIKVPSTLSRFKFNYRASLGAFLLILSSYSLEAKTYSDEQTWVNLNAFIKLNDEWQFYAEYQPRFFDYNRYNGAALHRAALGRNIGHGFSAWIGYALITWNERTNSKFPSKSQHEDRPFLMLMHSADISKKLKISNRTRLEDRLYRYEKEGLIRLRHMIRAQYALNDSPWALAVWDELFWNLNMDSGFDQNRAFVGMAYLFGENFQHVIETGFMNNYVHGAINDRNANVWMTTITGRF